MSEAIRIQSHNEATCNVCQSEGLHLPVCLKADVPDGLHSWQQFCFTCRRYFTYQSPETIISISEDLYLIIQQNITATLEGGMVFNADGVGTPAELTAYLNGLIVLESQGVKAEVMPVTKINFKPARRRVTEGADLYEKLLEQHRVKQQASLTRLREQQAIKIERIKADYTARLERLNDRIKTEKAAQLSRDERTRYDTLKAWTGESNNPLKIILHLLNAKQMDSGAWRIPSSDGDGSYEIPEDLSSCGCMGFQTHRRCSHLEALALRTRVQWGSKTVIEEVEIDNDDDDGIPF